MTAPFYLFGKQGFVAKSAQFAVIYCRATCRVRRLDAPMPRKRHEIFVNIYFADCPISAKPIQSYSKVELLIIGFYLCYAL